MEKFKVGDKVTLVDDYRDVESGEDLLGDEQSVENYWVDEPDSGVYSGKTYVIRIVHGSDIILEDTLGFYHNANQFRKVA